MPTLEACEQEIETLHEFFVEWYCGETDHEAFQKAEDALAPSFEIISPDSTIHDRETILSDVRNSFDSHEQGEFDIEIRNVKPVDVRDDRALVRYEEWQETPEGTTGRLSTALFGPTDESTGDQQSVEWLYLQETWLES